MAEGDFRVGDEEGEALHLRIWIRDVDKQAVVLRPVRDARLGFAGRPFGHAFFPLGRLETQAIEAEDGVVFCGRQRFKLLGGDSPDLEVAFCVEIEREIGGGCGKASAQ